MNVNKFWILNEELGKFKWKQKVQTKHISVAEYLFALNFPALCSVEISNKFFLFCSLPYNGIAMHTTQQCTYVYTYEVYM